MKIKEIIEVLNRFDPDMESFVRTDGGDLDFTVDGGQADGRLVFVPDSESGTKLYRITYQAALDGEPYGSASKLVRYSSDIDLCLDVDSGAEAVLADLFGVKGEATKTGSVKTTKKGEDGKTVDHFWRVRPVEAFRVYDEDEMLCRRVWKNPNIV